LLELPFFLRAFADEWAVKITDLRPHLSPQFSRAEGASRMSEMKYA
jgi:hypothetical protein